MELTFWQKVRDWLENLPQWVVGGVALLALIIAVMK
jgi:negative regulator of sigma E activity